MVDLRSKLIKIAIKETGYLEKSWSAYKADPSIIYSKTKGAGSDNITKYGFEMHKIYPATMDFPAAWCDAFVDWCFYTAFGLSTAKGLLGGGFDDYTVASATLYKNKNAYHKGTDGIAPGDQIFFRNSKRICHTGIVVAVDKDIIYTVEGNTSNKSILEPNGGSVTAKEYKRNYDGIDGYGRPPYEKYVKPTYPRWENQNGVWYYKLSENKYANGWKVINHHWYYFLTDGRMVTGVQDIKSDKYGLERYYFINYGDYEGALCKTNERGALEIWEV